MRYTTLTQALVATLLAVPLSAFVAALAFENAFRTADQKGARAYELELYASAAELFEDPAWRAASLFAAGEFAGAAAIWSGVPGPVAAFDCGNALVLLGKYEAAVESYERALALRPEWPEAEENRDIAESRIRTETALGQASEIGADDIVVDPEMDADKGDQVETAGGEESLGNDELRALWLRNVQTEPADFLRVKFAYQKAVQQSAAGPGTSDDAEGGGR